MFVTEIAGNFHQQASEFSPRFRHFTSFDDQLLYSKHFVAVNLSMRELLYVTNNRIIFIAAKRAHMRF